MTTNNIDDGLGGLSKPVVTRVTENGLMVNTGDGWERPTPIPFELWSFIGGWKPVCVRHKLIFQRRYSFYKDHANCEPESLSEYPASDLAIKAKGFRRVWL